MLYPGPTTLSQIQKSFEPSPFVDFEFRPMLSYQQTLPPVHDMRIAVVFRYTTEVRETMSRYKLNALRDQRAINQATS